jgi:hypothetical protein
MHDTEPGIICFDCPYLSGSVELSAERQRHIAERHPDLPLDDRELMAKVLAEPDQVRRSVRMSAAPLFSRWFGTLRGGKHVVVVVVSAAVPEGRHWVVTAYYLARRLAEGDIEWKRV